MAELQERTLKDLETYVNTCDGNSFGRAMYILGVWAEGKTLEDETKQGELSERFANECVCRKKPL